MTTYINGKLYSLLLEDVQMPAEVGPFEDAIIARIAEDIARNGLRFPFRFTVEDGRPTVRSHFKNFLAMRRLGRKRISAIYSTSEDTLSEDAASNLRKNINVHCDPQQWREYWQYGYTWSGEAPDFSHAARIADRQIVPYLPKLQGNHILEIAPGGGRMTHELLRYAASMTLVDLNECCIELCRERFRFFPHMTYHVNDGVSLDMVPDNGFDAIISFDSFVHIESSIVERYVRQFARKLAPHGVAWIHHGATGARVQGDRSDVNAEMMRVFAEKYGLAMAAQFFSNPFPEGAHTFGDCVTVMLRQSDLAAFPYPGV